MAGPSCPGDAGGGADSRSKRRFVNKENFIFENLYIAWIFQNSHTVTPTYRVINVV